MLKTDEQIYQTIKKSKKVLITCRHDVHEDSIASCLALYLFLIKMNIPTEMVVSAPDVHTWNKCSFLPKIDLINRDAKKLGHLVIKVSSKNAKVGDFRYEVENNTLNIYITPAKGSFDPADVKAETGKPNHDLIITCDTPDLDTIGDLYKEYADFFYHTPIINIDHMASNEQYGQINFIDITAVSTSEVLFRIFETIGDEHIDADIATALLTGMIAKTQSFKTPSVTPRALMIASDLVQRGARRDEIVHNLYRQHDLATLRLWGRVLARLQHDSKRQFVWSVVKREDFEKAGTDESKLPGIIDELITTTPQARTVALLYEQADGGIGVWLKTESHTNALELTKQWQSKGSRVLVQFVLPVNSLEEAGQEISKILNNVSYGTVDQNGI